MQAQIAALKKDFDERAAVSDKRMDELQARMSALTGLLPREEHYRIFRLAAEINRLYDLIVSVFKEMRKMKPTYCEEKS